ncbi:MAG TPA: EAL domain-containing protein [Planctomycetota bacterium]|nr:EAL domain-containing protein [Planctomycetota bacterium]
MKALLVRPTELDLEPIADVLRSRGHCVQSCPAEDASAAFKREPAELIVIGADSSESGVRLCRDLRSIANGSRSVIMAVAGGTLTHTQAMLDAGADDCMFAPLHTESIRQRVILAERLVEEIAERRHSEQQLRNCVDWLNQEVALVTGRLQDLSRYVPGIFYQIRRSPDRARVEIPYISEGVREFLGYTPEEVMNHPELLLGCIHADDRPVYQARVNEALDQLSPLQMEFRLTSRAGTVRWVKVSARGQWLPDGDSLYTGVAVDITEQKRVEQTLLETARELRETESKYRAIFENAVEGIFQSSPDGRYIRANPRLAQIYGYDTVEEMLDGIKDIAVNLYVAPNRRNEFRRELELSDAVRNFESEIYRKDGTTIWISESARAVRDADGNLLYYEGTVEDVTQRHRAAEALRKSELKYRTLLENMNEGLVIVDEKGNTQLVNDRFCEMVGYTREELLGTHESMLMAREEDRELLAKMSQSRSGGGRDQYELQLKAKSGKILWVLVSGSPVYDENGRVVGSMGIQTDITQRKNVEAQLSHDAFHDALTGLPNRVLFMDRLAQTLERRRRHSDKFFAVLFLDLDRFKVINDSLGHQAGDELLKEISRRLQRSVRMEDTVARMGGDEFTVILDSIHSVGEAMQVADRIQQDISTPHTIQNTKVFTTASIGIALCVGGERSADQLLRDADTAMYRAKTRGKARFEIFNNTMHTGVMAQLQLESDLRCALERNELRVVYQPLIDLKTGTIHGFEALLRWQHGTIGMVSPAEFIPLAEETGVILPIGKWVLQQACAQVRRWRTEISNCPKLMMSVNLSSKQFSQAGLVQQLAEILDETGLEASQLKLEITESVIMENARTTTSLLEQMRALGVELAIDDFGTGYSSLSYLHRLPIDALKIDRSFVKEMHGDAQKRAEIVGTIVTLAHNLNMNVIAEGIETKPQLEELRRLGCGYGQGYLFAKPLSPEDAAHLIRSAPKW